MSSDRFHHQFFNLPFSSSCFNRRISVGNNPSYFFQLK
ncbi:hypothetical protein AB7M46_005776 [Bradyrhizobium elkanii]